MRLLIAAVLACVFTYVHTHGHAHDDAHDHVHAHDDAHGHGHEEKPSYKWSKQANEQYQDADEETEELHQHPNANSHPKANSTPRDSVWGEALLATLGISIAPYIILFFIPITNRKEHESYLKILLAFASGGLLGDAFLHLIPHALMAKASVDSSHSHSHSHSHSEGATEGHSHDMSIGLAVLGGIIAFLVVEKVVRIFKGGHSHSHSHNAHTNAHTDEKKGGEGEGKKKGGEGEGKKKGEKEGDGKKKGDKKKNGNKLKKNEESPMKVAGFLNLAADFTHNLTDGLAIGASFLVGKNVGIVTALTIFLHEIPHEIGDFAILLQSGCSRRKAMMLQLVTAVGAFAGTCISLLAEGADASAIAWVLPFTAGGFIYIATVTVIPELLENTRFWQSVWEVVALLAGVMLMMGIAHLEEVAGHEH